MRVYNACLFSHGIEKTFSFSWFYLLGGVYVNLTMIITWRGALCLKKRQRQCLQNGILFNQFPPPSFFVYTNWWFSTSCYSHFITTTTNRYTRRRNEEEMGTVISVSILFHLPLQSFFSDLYLFELIIVLIQMLEASSYCRSKLLQQYLGYVRRWWMGCQVWGRMRRRN